MDFSTAKIYCKCEKVILRENMEYYGGTNEEGEEYAVANASCECGEYYECNQWGYWDNENEAAEALQDFINEKSR